MLHLCLIYIYALLYLYITMHALLCMHAISLFHLLFGPLSILFLSFCGIDMCTDFLHRRCLSCVQTWHSKGVPVWGIMGGAAIWTLFHSSPGSAIGLSPGQVCRAGGSRLRRVTPRRGAVTSTAVFAFQLGWRTCVVRRRGWRLRGGGAQPTLRGPIGGTGLSHTPFELAASQLMGAQLGKLWVTHPSSS